MEFLAFLLVLGGLVAQIPGIAGMFKPSLIRLKTRNQASVVLVGGWAAIVLGGLIAAPPQPTPVTSAPVESVAPVAAVEPVPPVVDESAQVKAELERVKSELEQAKAEAAQLKVDNEKARADVERLTVPPKGEEPTPPPACKLAGKVVGVADGDTITVLDAQNQQHKIRMMGIDAPEKAQPFGNAAQKHLSGLVSQKTVCIDWHKEDKYQRKVGKVVLDGVDIDLKMVEAGFAWHFKKYEGEQLAEDRELYAAAHDKAKSDTIGLWSEPDPIEPDAWRDGARPEKRIAPVMPDKDEPPVKAMAAESGASACGGKRYCKDMSSCAEACHYLNDCGISRLDKDGDGRPCETLCGRACN